MTKEGVIKNGMREGRESGPLREVVSAQTHDSKCRLLTGKLGRADDG